MAQSGISLSAEIDMLGQVLSLVEAFRAFDSDNDGMITSAELGGILGSLGYNASEQDVRSMMAQGDKNKDGKLSMDEFLDMNTKDMELGGGLGTFLRTVFEELDVDGDEIVTGEELFEVVENLEVAGGAAGAGLSLKDCREIVQALDGDGDGAVTFNDFKLIVNSLL